MSFLKKKIKVVDGNNCVKNLRRENIDGEIRYSIIGWHDMIQVEHISLGDDYFFGWSKTNSRLLVTNLQQEKLLE
ncbi:hypothetical protein Hanom_Chr03g00205961 [Helianthus anomalus]